jgi:hypothetical protein
MKNWKSLYGSILAGLAMSVCLCVQERNSINDEFQFVSSQGSEDSDPPKKSVSFTTKSNVLNSGLERIDIDSAKNTAHGEVEEKEQSLHLTSSSQMDEKLDSLMAQMGLAELSSEEDFQKMFVALKKIEAPWAKDSDFLVLKYHFAKLGGLQTEKQLVLQEIEEEFKQSSEYECILMKMNAETNDLVAAHAHSQNCNTDVYPKYEEIFVFANQAFP